MSESEKAFREFVHSTNQGRCGDMPGKGCRCFTLPIQAFTGWRAWQAAIAYSTKRERERLEKLAMNVEGNARRAWADGRMDAAALDYESAHQLREAAKGVGE